MSKEKRLLAAQVMFAALCALRVDRTIAFDIVWRLLAK